MRAENSWPTQRGIQKIGEVGITEVPPSEVNRRREKWEEGRGKSFCFFFLFFFLDHGFFVGVVFVVIFFLILIVGNGDEMNRMSLGYLEFGVTLVAAQDFAFFHFVFVEINFGVAFGTSGHGFLSFQGPACADERII
jgi:hypothetical protein